MLLPNYTKKRGSALKRIRIAELAPFSSVELLYLCASTGSDPRKISRQKHRHSFFEVHYVIEGRIVYETEDGRRHTLTGGDFLILPPCNAHEVCSFSQDMVKLSLTFRAEHGGVGACKIGRMDGHLLADLDALLLECEQKDGYASHMIGYRAAAAAEHALRTVGIDPLQKKGETAKSERKESALIDRIECYVADNTHLSLTCEALADYCHYNVRYLNRVFKEQTGITLLSYIHAKKAEAAKRMLSECDLSLSEIASALGFATPQYFHIFFKRTCGETPAAYRERATVKAHRVPHERSII